MEISRSVVPPSSSAETLTEPEPPLLLPPELFPPASATTARVAPSTVSKRLFIVMEPACQIAVYSRVGASSVELEAFCSVLGSRVQVVLVLAAQYYL